MFTDFKSFNGKQELDNWGNEILLRNSSWSNEESHDKFREESSAKALARKAFEEMSELFPEASQQPAFIEKYLTKTLKSI